MFKSLYDMPLRWEYLVWAWVWAWPAYSRSLPPASGLRSLPALKATARAVMSPPALMATFVPTLTVVPVSVLLPSMRELRLLQRMVSDWSVVTARG